MTKFDTIDETSRRAHPGPFEMGARLKIIAIRVTSARAQGNPRHVRRDRKGADQDGACQGDAEARRAAGRDGAEEGADRGAEKQDVERIEHAMQVAKRENEQKLQQIANDMHLAKARAAADAEFYRAEREAAANELLLTRPYLEDRAIAAIGNNTKMFFGEKLPNVFLDPSKLPGGA